MYRCVVLFVSPRTIVKVLFKWIGDVKSGELMVRQLQVGNSDRRGTWNSVLRHLALVGNRDVTNGLGSPVVPSLNALLPVDTGGSSSESTDTHSWTHHSHR